jgi:hypothetical protein
MRRDFSRRVYRRRALIESLFSSVKRKLSARAPGRSLRTQKRQALLLGLSFNLYRLRHRCLFSRMSTEPCYFKAQTNKAKNEPLRMRVFGSIKIGKDRPVAWIAIRSKSSMGRAGGPLFRLTQTNALVFAGAGPFGF